MPSGPKALAHVGMADDDMGPPGSYGMIGGAAGRSNGNQRREVPRRFSLVYVQEFLLLSLTEIL